MIREADGNFYICYDATGEPVYGPYRSLSAAETKYDGLSRFDQMVISCRAPQSVTDREFMEGTENGRQFQRNPQQGDFYRKVAEAEGQSVKGKKYISQLARYPGDPEAWVSGRGDVQARCEERGSGCAGMVNVKARDADEAAKPVDVADDILEREVAREAEGQPLRKRELMDLKEKVKGRLKPSWK